MLKVTGGPKPDQTPTPTPDQTPTPTSDQTPKQKDLYEIGDFRLRNFQPSNHTLYDEVIEMIEEANKLEGFYELSDNFNLENEPYLKNKIIEIMDNNHGEDQRGRNLFLYKTDSFDVYGDAKVTGTEKDGARNNLILVQGDFPLSLKAFLGGNNQNPLLAQALRATTETKPNGLGSTYTDEHYVLYSSKPEIFLGGNVRGYQPQLLGGGANSSSGSGMVGSNERGMSRTMLRKSFGRTNWLDDVTGKKNVNKSTPFRVAMNAGDINGTKNASPMKELKPPNQVNGVNALMGRLYGIGDGVKHGGAAYSGNPNYVYDSSDYIRYKKLGAKLKTYNTISFGGPPKSSNPFLMAMRK